jgi:transposase-like protein
MVQKTTAPEPQREALWRQRLADQAASGMTIAQWCRQNGVSGSLFHYWRRALAKRDGRRLGRRRRPAATKHEAQIQEAENQAQIQHAAFARVVIAAPTTKLQLAASVAESAIEIELPGRGLVRVGAGFDAAALARVLEERSC